MKILTVQSLSKYYRQYPSPRAKLKEALLGVKCHEEYWALRDVSFDLKKGESLGIIGDNGAGKSTLLKLVAGTLRPSTGKVVCSGRLTAILELGAGFHPDFSGRENTYFAASLMGISKKEMDEYFDEIVSFAELEDFIDRPVKTYSSGMFVRLAFSLVTSVKPDVLVVDEALSVGDQHFQKKCIDRLTGFRKLGCTILFCSHSMYHIRRLCNNAIWLHKGKPMALGATEAVVGAYENHMRSMENNSANSGHDNMNAEKKMPEIAGGENLAGLESLSLQGISNDDGHLLIEKDLTVYATAWTRDSSIEVNFGILIERGDGVWLNALGTHLDGVKPRRLDENRWGMTLCFKNVPILAGEYFVSVYLFDASGLLVYEEWLKHTKFTVISPKEKIGLVELPHEWL